MDFLETYTANEFRMFCLLTRYRSAIDYSDASMVEARSSLSSLSTFSHDAQAYMTGQLLCQPVQEGALWQSLSETKASVLAALADDFDTPRAVNAVMNLIHHGNRNLQPVTKCDGSPRRPAVFGAILSYVRDFFQLLGVDLVDLQSGSMESKAADRSGTLENVVEQLARFRSDVRAFALAPRDAPPGSPASSRPKPRPDREPLLQACDTLRRDLAPLGVLVKDRGTNSTWEISHKRPSEQETDK